MPFARRNSPSPSAAGAHGRTFGERNFKYLLVGPAIFVLLLIGVFPLVYLLMVSFQGITMTNNDASFQGLRNYALLFNDSRLWESLLHTVIFTASEAPITNSAPRGSRS